ncbi:MAG TPA: ABC transporter ATP-binding protein [Blastocatellia bacterium]|nr:ABC transporter ATP-binding protein [Blastocatellia bacterium]
MMESTSHPVSAISIRSLNKSYGRLRAVDGLSLEVRQGETLGFLGLNGAGKTTTIRILLDLLRPTSGKALIFGRDCQRDGLNARSQVGYLPGEMGIYSDLTGRDVLAFLAGIGNAKVDKQFRNGIQRKLELADSDLKRRLREYSTGMKRKLGLIQAFQADPPLLILDEPTEGLDPLMQESFYELLFDARRQGRTVFMSSHVLSEVERVCDRIALLRKGKLVLLSTVEEIRKLAARKVRVFFAENVTAPVEFPQMTKRVHIEDNRWTLTIHGELGPLFQVLSRLPVRDIEIEEPKLEDVLIKYYKDSEANIPDEKGAAH